MLSIVLAVGGQASICSVIELSGLEMHHHEIGDRASTCSESHSSHEEIPCDEVCEITLADAVAPSVFKVPTATLLFIEETPWLTNFTVSGEYQVTAKRLDFLDPPDFSEQLCPAFTGRFLV